MGKLCWDGTILKGPLTAMVDTIIGIHSDKNLQVAFITRVTG